MLKPLQFFVSCALRSRYRFEETGESFSGPFDFPERTERAELPLADFVRAAGEA